MMHSSGRQCAIAAGVNRASHARPSALTRRARPPSSIPEGPDAPAPAHPRRPARPRLASPRSAVSAAPAPVERLLGLAQRTTTAFDAASGEGQVVWHRWGRGAPVVLLHGGAGSWRHWVRNVDALLAAGRTVWAPDLPGLG